MALGEYLTSYNEVGGTFTFPDVQTAMKYVDEMTDDDYFIVEDAQQSDVLAMFQRVFGY